MEAAAVDKLVDKGEFRPQVAQAIAEAVDITIKAANFVTVPVLDARLAAQDAKIAETEARLTGQIAALDTQFTAQFAAQDVKMEARFGRIEKSIESAKVWAALLYAGLAIALFSALAVDHHWLVTREDQFVAQMEARTDARFAAEQARVDQRIDARFAAEQSRLDQQFQQYEARMDARMDARDARMDAKFEQLRELILGKPSTRRGATPQDKAAPQPH